MLKDLEILRELQKIDLEIDEMQKKREFLPRKVESLNLQLQEEKSKIAEKRQKFLDLEKKKRSLELDLKEKEEKKRRTEERLMAVKSNDEYQAMQKEVEMVNKENGIIEEQILEYMLQLDEAKGDINEFEKELASRTHTIESEIQVIHEEYAKLDHFLNEKQEVREKNVNALQQEVLSTYNRIRSKIGLAVTEARKGKCMGCDIAIPPQLYNQIYREDSFYLCPNCHRILILSKD